MNWKGILRIQGLLLIILSATMIFPLLFAIFYKSNDISSLLIGIGASFVAGIILFKLFHSDKPIKAKEGFVIVSLGWIFATIFGAIPFWVHGSVGTYIDCVFETMSGLTTTGATILTNIEGLSKGLMFWRSLTHWLGGMGIILLTIAILPILGLSSVQMFKAEVPGPTKDKISPKIKNTAKILWGIYGGMTVVETILLMFGGMNLYDALCHTFGTLATGGFSTLNTSVGGFNSVYIEVVIIIFMFLAGVNFALHFHLLRGNFRDFFKNRELQFYTGVIVIAILLITINIHFHTYSEPIVSKNAEIQKITGSLGQSLRMASFQVVSIITTTGFCTANFDIWPNFSRLLLVILMFFGGCAGSTGGGMKQIRIMVTLKFLRTEILKLINPRAIYSVKVENDVVPNFVVKNIIAFVMIFIGIFASVSLFLTFMGYDIITSFTASIATLGNIGPGLARVGAIENFAFFDPISKLVLTFAMLLGRLELYSVLILIYFLIFQRSYRS